MRRAPSTETASLSFDSAAPREESRRWKWAMWACDAISSALRRSIRRAASASVGRGVSAGRSTGRALAGVRSPRIPPDASAVPLWQWCELTGSAIAHAKENNWHTPAHAG